MKKDVIVSVKGTQLELDLDEPVEVISRGTYYEKNKKIYIRYEEMEENKTTSICMIKISENHIEIIKKGAYPSCMVFEQGKNCMTPYDTPLGKLMIGVTTNEMIILEDEDNLIVKLKYLLDINYQHVSECKVEIRVVSAD